MVSLGAPRTGAHSRRGPTARLLPASSAVPRQLPRCLPTRQSARLTSPPSARLLTRLPALSLTVVLVLLTAWGSPALGLQPAQDRAPAHQRAQEPGTPEPAGDPLAPQQWYLDWREEPAVQGDGQGVSVGVMDSGVDATHPEIESSYDAARSRSFLSPGCEEDSRCTDLDPAYDPYGHGTEVAGLITADVDGHGIAGAAPGATIVSLKAGDATGRFYPDAVAQALRYAADADLDVVVMSLTTDPWFRYCPDAPGDTEQERQQQAEDLATITSALDYAARHGVIMVAAAGNEFFDLDHGATDLYSTGWSGQGERPVTDQCVTMPAQSEHVLTVGALDPSGARASYSNVGSAVDIAAPGGTPVWYDDTDTPHGTESAILTTAPTELVKDAGTDEDGVSEIPDVVSDCSQGRERCRYYWYRSGTSFATPLAAAALAVLLSYGTTAQQAPDLLLDLAGPAACPAPEEQDLPCRRPRSAPGTPPRGTATARCGSQPSCPSAQAGRTAPAAGDRAAATGRARLAGPSAAGQRRLAPSLSPPPGGRPPPA